MSGSVNLDIDYSTPLAPQEPLHIVHIISGLGRGGAEGALYRLVSQMQDRHTFTVISLSAEGYYGERLRNQGVNVQALGNKNGSFSFAAIYDLYKILSKLSPDVIQTWMYHSDLLGGVVAKLVGCKTIIWSIRHSRLDQATLSLSARVVTHLATFLAPYIPTRIASCSFNAAVTHSEAGYPSEKMSVIANGFDLSQWKPDPAAAELLKQELQLHNHYPVIGCVGNYTAEKNQELLLKAVSILMKDFPDIKCVLVGIGLIEDNDLLMEHVKENGVGENVVLLGQRHDIQSIMSALDLHVLPSKTEGFPNVIGEAMACGTPCVATAVGDAEIIIGNTGWIVPPCNPEALAASIKSAISFIEKQGKQALSEHCRKRISDEFSVEKMGENFELLWLEARTNG